MTLQNSEDFNCKIPEPQVKKSFEKIVEMAELNSHFCVRAMHDHVNYVYKYIKEMENEISEIGQFKSENRDLKNKYDELQFDNDALKQKNEVLKFHHSIACDPDKCTAVHSCAEFNNIRDERAKLRSENEKLKFDYNFLEKRYFNQREYFRKLEKENEESKRTRDASVNVSFGGAVPFNEFGAFNEKEDIVTGAFRATLAEAECIRLNMETNKLKEELHKYKSCFLCDGNGFCEIIMANDPDYEKVIGYANIYPIGSVVNELSMSRLFKIKSDADYLSGNHAIAKGVKFIGYYKKPEQTKE